MTGKRQVQVDRIGKTGVIRLDRPDVLNAYTPDMGDELVDAFRTLASDSEVCAIVLTGKGRAFCVGADRNFLNGEKGHNGLRLGEEDFIGGFATELLTIAKPTIAAINGKAVGLGCTMLLPLDFRIAADSASFSFPFARLGLMPGMGSTFLLPRIVGDVAAREIMFGSAVLDSGSALRAGLIGEVVADDQLQDAAMRLAATFETADAATLAAIKSTLNGAAVRAMNIAVETELRKARECLAARSATQNQEPIPT